MPDRIGAARDGYVDLVRAVALCVVVVGHWLNAVVTYADGRFDLGYLLLLTPQTQYLTLLMQVMPVVFLVAGYANAASWTKQQGRRPYRSWVFDRVGRVVRPTATLVVSWIAGGSGLLLAGIDLHVIAGMARHALGPLWFLGIYLPLVAVAPLTLRLHQRYGWWVVAGFSLLTAAGEAARTLTPTPGIAWANCAWVWLAFHQLGYHWQDGTFHLPRRSTALVLGGAGSLALLLAVGDFPINMVDRRNTTPPSFALLALGYTHIGAVGLLRSRAERWLGRGRLDRLLPATNSLAMLVYLWHVTAVMLLAVWLVVPGIWPQVTVGTTIWWAWRLPWLILVSTITAGLVSAAAQVESHHRGRPRAPRPRHRRRPRGRPRARTPSDPTRV